MKRILLPLLLVLIVLSIAVSAQDAKMLVPEASNTLAGTPEAFLASCRGDLTDAKKRVADLEQVQQTDQKSLADKQLALREATAELAAAVRAWQSAKTSAASAAQAFEEAKSPYALKLLPVVGFSADWAGPEAAEASARKTSLRSPNLVLTSPKRALLIKTPPNIARTVIEMEMS